MRYVRYDVSDTIVAVSSPTSEQRVIIRITGPDTVSISEQVFRKDTECIIPQMAKAGVVSGFVAVDEELKVDAKLYLFLAPHSYTGDDVVEIHTNTNPAVTEALMGNLFKRGLRMAEPGEFTARAFLNGKIDLAQAEAVNEIIVSSNEYQLAAAEKLLDGRLGEMTAKLRESLMDCLSLIEAGLDFSSEDIEFIARPEVIKRLAAIKDQLEQLLSGSISYESVIDLPAVGIAGAPNAGKSSLLNKLLGKERSIVSHKHKTTRDVLTGVCTLSHCRCVLFDCAGLVINTEDVLDELAQQAAIEALRKSNVVIFCVDISKVSWDEDIEIRKLIEPSCVLRDAYSAKKKRNTQYDIHNTKFVPVTTKCDLLSEHILPDRLAELNESFSEDFLPISTETGLGLEKLRNTIDEKLIGLALGGGKRGTRDEGRETSLVALTARHRQAVTEAIENVSESIDELKAGNDEVNAMMLRTAYQVVSDIDSRAAAHIDEQILEQIFSRFCIGK